MNLKNVCLILLIIGVLAISAVNAGLFGSDPVEVTVDGVDFVLDNEAEIIMEEDDMAGFKIDKYARGYIVSVNDTGLDSYIQNNTEQLYLVSEIEPESKGIDKYSFVDKASNIWGYFIVFEKDNKQFIFQVYTDLDDESALSLCSALLGQFVTDNDMYIPI